MSSSHQDGSVSFPINSLEPKTLQAIYHQVTGKTENIKKNLSGNVLISDNDIADLFNRIFQQLRVHDNICDPTVTIVVNYANDGVLTYSSWERFKKLRQPNSGITSELTLKFEAVIRLPQTGVDQRIVININIDSGLPVISSDKDVIDDFPHELRYFMFARDKWETVNIEISYVDFIVAKSFIHLTEEWFKNLNPSYEGHEWARKAIRFLRKYREYFDNCGRLFYAITMFSFFWFRKGNLTPEIIVLAIAISGFVMYVTNIVITSSFWTVVDTINSRIVPSIILVDEFDRRAFTKYKESLTRKSLISKVSKLVFDFCLALGSSVVSGYVFGVK